MAEQNDDSVCGIIVALQSFSCPELLNSFYTAVSDNTVNKKVERYQDF